MPPVAYETNSGMAVLATRGTDVSRCGGVACYFLFSPSPFFDGFIGDVLFTFLQLLMEKTAPAAAVFRNVFPVLGVDFQGFHTTFAHSLVPQLWMATGSFANSKFSKEDVPRYSAILYAVHMANPAHSAKPE